MDLNCRFRIGRLVVDPSARRVSCDGREVALQPKVFDLLGYLARHAGQAVSQAELLEAVWGRSVASDTVVTVAVRKLRQVLETTAELPDAITTLRGVGYRLDAPIEWLSEAETVSASGARATRWRATVVIVLLVGLAVAWQFLFQPVQSMPRIALLDTDNATGNAELDWARAGTTALMVELLQRRGVDVVTAQQLQQLRDAVTGEVDSLEAATRMVGVDRVYVPRLMPTTDGFRLEVTDLAARDATTMALAGSDPAGLSLAMAGLMADQLRAPLPAPPGAGRLADRFLNEAYARAFHYRISGNLQASRELFELVQREAPDDHWARYQLAVTLQQMGLPAETDALLGTLAKTELNDPSLTATVHLTIGNQLWLAGDIDAAQERYLAAEGIYLAIGQRDGLVLVLGSLANVARARSDYERSEAYLLEVLAIAREQGNRVFEARALHNLGSVYGMADRHSESLQVLNQAYAIRTELGLRGQAAGTLGVIGGLLLSESRLAEAVALLEQVLEIHRETGDRRNQGIVLADLVNAADQQGDYHRAHALAVEAATLARLLNDASGMAYTAFLVGRSLHTLGDWLAAEQQYQLATAEWARMGNRHAELDTLVGRIRLALDRERFEDADTLLGQLGAGAAAFGDARLIRSHQGLVMRSRIAQGYLDDVGADIDRLFEGLTDHASKRGELAVELAEALHRADPNHELMARLMTTVTDWAPRSYRAARLNWLTAADQHDCRHAENALRQLRGNHWYHNLPSSPACSP
jgi:DNA-binding winged helix-turn-helix (wHTH) protein/tetratricopeptide (TPR) repeat protein